MADLNDLTQNVNIWNDEKSKSVTVTTDGAKERLDVTLGESAEFQLQAFTPLVAVDATGVTLSTTAWTTLLNHTEVGKLDFIACLGSSSNYRVRFTVDGVLVFNVSMADLSAIGLSNASNVPIWAEVADKNFRYHPKTPIDYKISVLIEVQATSTTPSAPVVKSLIAHREAA